MPTRNIRMLIGGAAVVACAVIGAVVIACSSTSGGTGSGTGMATVSISDPATCSSSGSGLYQNVFVTITDVQANTSSSAGSNDAGWVDLTPNLKSSPQQIDLLGQTNNSCFLATLGDAQELQAGSYQQIRLILAPDNASISNNACANVNSANCVVLDDTNRDMYPLQLTSEAKTGLKIPSGQIAGGQFSIAAGQTKDLNIDFNTCASIVQTGSGKYILKPVLHAGEVSTTSTSINGKVNVSTGTNAAFSGTVLVALEPEGASTSTGTGGLVNAEPINMITQANADGSFVFCPIPAGNYDLVVVAMDTSGQIYEPSIITGVTNGETTGTINVYSVSASTTTTFPTTSGVPIGAITVNGQATTDATVGENVVISAFETVGGATYTIPVPAAVSTSGVVNLMTSSTPTPASPVCPTGTLCANFGVNLPVAAPNIGAWSSSGTTLNPGTGLAVYTLDGVAAGCTTTGEVQEATPALMSSSSALIDLTSTPFKFAGCS